MNEPELIAAAKAGDQDAFAELYRKHLPTVKAVSRSILRTGDIDDVCQDVFLLAFTRLRQFDGHQQNFGAWIRKIALNRSLSISRAANPQPLSLSEVGEDGESTCEEMLAYEDRELSTTPDRVDLDRNVEALPRPMQAAIVHKYWTGLTLEENGRRMRITPQGANARVRRAIYELRKAYGIFTCSEPRPPVKIRIENPAEREKLLNAASALFCLQGELGRYRVASRHISERSKVKAGWITNHLGEIHSVVLDARELSSREVEKNMIPAL